jgi:phosphoribosylamine-glycine ligase
LGPSKVGAQLKEVKNLVKEFLVKHNIPIFAYDSFYKKETVEEGCKF